MRQLLERAKHKGMRVRVGDRKQRVLITGATDRIGLALARLYAREGAELSLTGRRPVAELDPTLFAAGVIAARIWRARMPSRESVAS